MEAIETRVTVAMNEKLLSPFEAAEVDLALSQMHPLKSPGPDGFAVVFYQKSWATIRNEVCLAILDFLNGGFF